MKVTINNILNCKKYQANNTKATSVPSFGVLIAKSPNEDVFMRPFETKIGKEALIMNKIAVEDLKNQEPIDYSQASKSDLKRIGSVNFEDSYKRCFWTNPKNGKKYIILEEEGRSKDSVPVRILDDKCHFVKNAVLKPVTVVIIDTNKEVAEIPCKNSNPISLNHLQLVEAFAKRNNPFANYEIHTLKKDENEYIDLKSEIKELKKIYSRIKKGEKIFAINCSFGCEENVPTENQKNPKFVKKYKSGFKDTRIYEKVASKGTRVLCTAGNSSDEKSFNKVIIDLFADGIEGVGGLNGNGNVSHYSSRNSAFVQHYEKAKDFVWEACSNSPGEINGANITGIWGADFKCEPDTDKPIKKISGTSFAVPTRTAKLALNKMMEGIID